MLTVPEGSNMLGDKKNSMSVSLVETNMTQKKAKIFKKKKYISQVGWQMDFICDGYCGTVKVIGLGQMPTQGFSPISSQV